MRKWIPFIAIILISSCTTFMPVDLPIPPEPTYPKIKSSELQCLSDQAYTNLVKRDRMKSAHIKTLEGIIRSLKH